METHLRTELDKLAKKNAQEFIDYLVAESFNSPIDIKHKGALPLGSTAWKFLDTIERMRNPKDILKDKLEYIRTDAENKNPWLRRPTLPTASTDLEKLEEQVRKEYPILDMIQEYNLQTEKPTDFKPVADYIRLVEGK